MGNFSSLALFFFFPLAKLQTVGNSTLCREMKGTVDSNPYYSSVFTVQMNKRPPSTDLSCLVPFYLQIENLLCKHVTYCVENYNWATIWHS